MCAWRNNKASDEEACAAERRGLGLLLEGTAVHQVQVDGGTYQRFRSSILRDSIQLTEPQEEADLLQTIGTIIRQFEAYRIDCETTLTNRQKEWRQVAAVLMSMLAARDRVDTSADLWTKLGSTLVAATTTEEIQTLRAKLQTLFQRSSEELVAKQAEEEEEQDRSTANDNAAGLLGGGAAIEQVRSMLAAGRPGYVGLFSLSCLDVVGERFGPEGMQDCFMAVSAFLIQAMRAEDKVYHWSDSTLLAVCDRKVREEVLAAELNRVLAHNRDFTIQIGNRTIMLRIPIELQLFPTTYFDSADDLQKLSSNQIRGDRTLSDRALIR
jgi:GGDEF domain-containing protein